MFHCYEESLQVFYFVMIHRSWHQNFPLKNMIRVLKEMLGWFWIFVWIFMLIPTSNNISFGFAYVIFLTRADPFIDFTWRVWIFLLQREKLSDFLCFPNNSKIILFLVKTFNFFNSCLDALSFSLQNRISIKTIGFYSKLLNK